MSTADPTTILIVEDEALIAMELHDRLTRLGYKVTGTAARGERALEQLAGNVPDVVLMDINLAGQLNGIETAARLRETHDLPVVFLTAYSDDELLQKAGETQPSGFLVKPFEERELHATIQVALYKHAAEKRLRETNRQLQEALANVKRLQGLVPICMCCKKIRDPRDYWHDLETYLSEHTEAKFSHGYCPQCFEVQMQAIKDFPPVEPVPLAPPPASPRSKRRGN